MLPEGWAMTKLADVIQREMRPVKVHEDVTYREIGIRSHCKGIFHKPAVTGASIGEKRVFEVVPDALVLNIVFAWEQAIAVTSSSEVGMIASHRFPMYRSLPGRCDINYLKYFFSTPRGKELLELASPGGAGRNKTLGQKEFEKLCVPMPLDSAEQTQITKILATWDNAIRNATQLLQQTKQMKQAMMRKTLMPLHPSDWKKYGWNRRPLGELVDIDAKSLSGTTKSDYAFRYISLADVAQGKILNTLRTLTFDTAPSRARRVVRDGDVLMSTVRPNLKGYARVKKEHEGCIASTGFAVLSTKNDVNPGYIYQYLHSDDIQRQINSLIAGSNYPAINSPDVEDLLVNLPAVEVQNYLATLLETQDYEITILETQVKLLTAERVGLMQQLMSGKRRISTSKQPMTKFA